MTSSSIWSSAASEKFAFSPNCQDWALTTHDGRLSIWDSDTGRIKQEFIPSAHLSSACTCLAWMPATENDTKKKK
jgi:U3 small nucleolar RNA-associated protein 5